MTKEKSEKPETKPKRGKAEKSLEEVIRERLAELAKARVITKKRG